MRNIVLLLCVIYLSGCSSFSTIGPPAISAEEAKQIKDIDVLRPYISAKEERKLRSFSPQENQFKNQIKW
jgi:hypothetical protein